MVEITTKVAPERVDQKHEQKGAVAILAVVVMSMAIVVTLSTVYIYLINRANYHARIREAYQLTHVMEEFGKVIRGAFDANKAAAGGGVCGGANQPVCCSSPNNTIACCPANSVVYDVPNTNPLQTLCFPPCPGGVGACGTTTNANLCIQHLNSTYCLEKSLDPRVASNAYPGFEVVAKSEVEKTRDSIKFPSLSRWYSHLEAFYSNSLVDTKIMEPKTFEASMLRKPSLFGWMARASQALACTIASTDSYCIEYCRNEPTLCGGGSTQPNLAGTEPSQTVSGDPLVTTQPPAIVANPVASPAPVDKGMTNVPVVAATPPGQTTIGQDYLVTASTTPAPVPAECTGHNPPASCLQYCDRKEPPAMCGESPAIVVPNCASTPSDPVRCQSCDFNTGKCLRMGYCFENTGGVCPQTGDPGTGVVEYKFEQFVNLVQ